VNIYVLQGQASYLIDRLHMSVPNSLHAAVFIYFVLLLCLRQSFLTALPVFLLSFSSGSILLTPQLHANFVVS
jgi:hypothetical protein